MTDLDHDSSLQEKIDFIRGALSPLDLVEVLGLEEHRGKIVSPFNPDERTPSCHLYEDGWFDFSTGKHGDVIDLYRALTGEGLGRAVNRLLEGAQRMDADPDRVVRRPVELPDLRPLWIIGHIPVDADEWSGRLTPISSSTLDFLNHYGMIGRHRPDDGSMAIAHWHDGVVRGIKLRSPSGAKSAVPGSTFACGLYSAHVPTGSRTAVITEGESDCWALMQAFGEGVSDPYADVYALPSGAGLWKDHWLQALEGYSTIYTAFDNDRAGRQATEKVRSAIGWGRWKELAVPTLFNDVREAMAAGWEPKL